jgi:5-deoxy-glucuronate isomerase
MTDQGNRWFLPLGTARRDGCEVVVDDGVEGWQHTGLRIVELRPGSDLPIEAGDWEYIVVPLSGSVWVTSAPTRGREQRALLAGRTSVFAGPTDVAYSPAGSSLVLSAAQPARVAVCGARVTSRAPKAEFRHVEVDDVPVELRGAGRASREVRNFGVPAVVEADSMIACEVVTPAGNWSSYPPHKHDEERDGVETELEEIYYFETRVEGGATADAAASGAPADPLGYQRVYGTDERPIDVFAEVRTGDVVLVPHGWHGPSMAAPGYDLYYLNVMAGPGSTRAWLICDDPRHGWVRSTWDGMAVDPRLPMREGSFDE